MVKLTFTAVLTLMIIMLALFIVFARRSCTWVVITVVRTLASPGSYTPLAMWFAAAVTRGGSVGRWRFLALSWTSMLVVIPSMRKSLSLVPFRTLPWEAARGPLAGSTTTPSCRRTSTSIRPCWAVVVVAGVGELWRRRPASGPLSLVASVPGAALAVSTRYDLFLTCLEMIVIGMPMDMTDASCPLRMSASPGSYTAPAMRLSAAVVGVGSAGRWWSSERGPLWPRCPSTAWATSTPLAWRMLLRWQASTPVLPAGPVSLLPCRRTSTSIWPLGAVVVVAGVGGVWVPWSVDGLPPWTVSRTAPASAAQTFASPSRSRLLVPPLLSVMQSLTHARHPLQAYVLQGSCAVSVLLFAAVVKKRGGGGRRSCSALSP